MGERRKQKHIIILASLLFGYVDQIAYAGDLFVCFCGLKVVSPRRIADPAFRKANEFLRLYGIHISQYPI